MKMVALLPFGCGNRKYTFWVCSENELGETGTEDVYSRDGQTLENMPQRRYNVKE